MRISRPFAPIPDAAPWQVLLEVPRAVLQAPAIQLNQRLDASNQSANLLNLLIALVTALAGLVLVWLTARGVTRPILVVAERLREIASGDGDLTQRLDYSRDDELGQLSGWFNRFLDKLQPVIVQVKTRCRTGVAAQSSWLTDGPSRRVVLGKRIVDLRHASPKHLIAPGGQPGPSFRRCGMSACPALQMWRRSGRTCRTATRRSSARAQLKRLPGCALLFCRLPVTDWATFVDKVARLPFAERAAPLPGRAPPCYPTMR